MLVNITICEVVDDAACATARKSTDGEQAKGVRVGYERWRAECKAPVAWQEQQVSANLALHSC